MRINGGKAERVRPLAPSHSSGDGDDHGSSGGRPGPRDAVRKVAFVLYPDFTALDLVGPYEIISRWPEVDVRFVARSFDPVKTDRGLTVIPTDTTKTLLDPDLIVIPGSGNPLPLLEDDVLREWLRATAPRCGWTASVCTGAGLYAAAGLLDGKKTSTHWGFRDNLRALGIDVVDERVVWQGTHVSAAGVSAGIDMALSLTEQVYGRTMAEALQLVIEYDPQPAFDSGSLNKASGATQRLAKRILLGDHPVRMATRMSRQILRARLARVRRALSARGQSPVALQER
jgi:transcriptional regulator GlxA family with amidase domain